MRPIDCVSDQRYGIRKHHSSHDYLANLVDDEDVAKKYQCYENIVVLQIETHCADDTEICPVAKGAHLLYPIVL